MEHDDQNTTNVTSRFAKYPLRFLFTNHKCSSDLPSNRSGNCIWAYPITFGGGLVSGDYVNIKVVFLPLARCVVTTQASTKVYREREKALQGDPVTRLNTLFEVHENALCCNLPDPLTCFQGSRYAQQLRIHLAPTANLIHVVS